VEPAASFYLRNGWLVSVNPATGALVWEGLPGGLKVARLIDLPGTNECVALLDTFSTQPHYPRGFDPKQESNLLRCRGDGSIVWRAEIPKPTQHDSYVYAILEAGVLWANSWSCYRNRINLETGRIEESVFTK
jgi:hypothetical protein